MLSRIADSLFWLSRYMERSDGLIRGTKTNYILLLDKGINKNLNWKPMLECFTYCSKEEIEELKDNTEEALQTLLLKPTNTNSLKTIVGKARENARGVQDLITKEVWEHVNQLYHNINNLSIESSLNGYGAITTIEQLEQGCVLYNGVSDTTMPRGLGWGFMNLGRYIERCMLTIEMTNNYFAEIEYKIQEEKDILQWRPLLLALSGYELHLKTYRSSSHNLNALHQVLFNENFTRSILYSLKRIEKYLKDVVENNEKPEAKSLSKQLGRLVSKIEFADFDALSETNLKEFLFSIRVELIAFSNQLTKHFFSYT